MRQAHFESASKSGMHGSEEQNEGRKMKVDSVVTLESQPTKPKIIFDTEIFFNATNNFDDVNK